MPTLTGIVEPKIIQKIVKVLTYGYYFFIFLPILLLCLLFTFIFRKKIPEKYAMAIFELSKNFRFFFKIIFIRVYEI